MISLARVLIYWIRSRGCIDAPRWSHRGNNIGYKNSFAAVVVVLVAKAVVAGYMAAVMVPEDMEDMEEGEGTVEEFRQ